MESVRRMIARAEDILGGMLESHGQHRINFDDGLFVKDSDIAFDLDRNTYTISRSVLFDTTATDLLTEMWAGGPSWVHFALILSLDEKPLVSLSTGASLGNPAPAINVSLENKRIVIIDP